MHGGGPGPSDRVPSYHARVVGTYVADDGAPSAASPTHEEPHVPSITRHDTACQAGASMARKDGWPGCMIVLLQI
jgi:hypothetical protein